MEYPTDQELETQVDLAVVQDILHPALLEERVIHLLQHLVKETLVAMVTLTLLTAQAVVVVLELLDHLIMETAETEIQVVLLVQQ